MTTRPHLVLDGALLAARALKASQVVALYRRRAPRRVGGRWPARSPSGLSLSSGVHASSPPRIATSRASRAQPSTSWTPAIATPTTKPPEPHVAGRGRAPTLVQNVETLAHIALIARHGADWYRSLGRRGGVGTLLVTAAGSVPSPGVLEIEAGTTVREVLEMAGGATVRPAPSSSAATSARWVDAAAQELPLDAAALRQHGLGLGCGVVGVISSTTRAASARRRGSCATSRPRALPSADPASSACARSPTHATRIAERGIEPRRPRAPASLGSRGSRPRCVQATRTARSCSCSRRCKPSRTSSRSTRPTGERARRARGVA